MRTAWEIESRFQEFDIGNLTSEWETTTGFDSEALRTTLLRNFGLVNKCSLAYFRPMLSVNYFFH